MKGILLNISHPFDVYFFIKLKKYVLDAYDTDLVCFVAYSKQMKGMEHLIKTISKNVFYATAKDCRYFNTNIFSNFKNILNLVNESKKYKGYTLLSLDQSMLTSNILLSRFKHKILFQHSMQRAEHYKSAKLLSAYANLYCILFGLHHINVEVTNSKDIEKSIKLKKKIQNIVYLEETKNCSFVTFPIQRIYDGDEIIIFGGRFFDWKLSDELLVDKIFHFYNSLKSLYPDLKYRYIPHPRESKKEIKFLQKIFNGKLIEEEASIPAEFYLKDTKINKFCISIGSTSSRYAYLNGFRSYVFYKLLDLDNTTLTALDEIHSGMPEEYFLFNINELKKEYRKLESNSGFFDHIHSRLNE
jgi:hypothetical protein